MGLKRLVKALQYPTSNSVSIHYIQFKNLIYQFWGGGLRLMHRDLGFLGRLYFSLICALVKSASKLPPRSPSEWHQCSHQRWVEPAMQQDSAADNRRPYTRATLIFHSSWKRSSSNLFLPILTNLREAKFTEIQTFMSLVFQNCQCQQRIKHDFAH